MQVKLGDGRIVECASGIQKLPPGPMPEALGSEMVRPLGYGPVHREGGRTRDVGESAAIQHVPNHRVDVAGAGVYAPVPSSLRGRFAEVTAPWSAEAGAEKK